MLVTPQRISRLSAIVGGAALAVIAASLLIADLLHAGAGRAAPVPARKIETPNAPGFPSPPSGAVVFARQDGANALALVETSDGIGYILKTGDTLADGRLVEISANTVVFAIAPKPGSTTNKVVLRLLSD